MLFHQMSCESCLFANHGDDPMTLYWGVGLIDGGPKVDAQIFAPSSVWRHLAWLRHVGTSIHRCYIYCKLTEHGDTAINININMNIYININMNINITINIDIDINIDINININIDIDIDISIIIIKSII